MPGAFLSPRGLIGEDLTNRTDQAWLFGADIVITRATGLTARGQQRLVWLADGSEVAARAVIIATGVTWRRLGVPALEPLVGAGVFYGAASAEARATAGPQVFVIGAGNSAAQAALHLARYAASVTVAIRGPGLRPSMSEYLVTEISKTSNITVRRHTEGIGGGHSRLEALTLRHRPTGTTTIVPAAALFVMIGTEPRTQWLEDSVARDGRGFILTGRAYPGPVNHRPTGRCSARRCCWKQAFPGSSPPGTCGTGRSNESRRPSAKAPPPSSSCTSTCTHSDDDAQQRGADPATQRESRKSAPVRSGGCRSSHDDDRWPHRG